MSKFMEAIAFANNEGKSVTAFLQKISLTDLKHLGPLLVMGDPTFATSCSKGYGEIWGSP